MTTNIGFVFPGQGSQSIGMLADIAREFPEVIATFSEASDVLGYDLWELTQAGPAEKLNNTIHTQPALLTASYAIWKIVQSHHKIQPTLLAGHSLGEYTALVCANAIPFAEAVSLVAARGKYMQEAVPDHQGALAAIVGLDHATVAKLCLQAVFDGEVLAPANFNSPEQVVIAGHAIAVERAITLANEAGAKLAKLLPVSVPSHCQLMKPAAEKLEKLLQVVPIQAPSIPVISNVDVAVYSDANEIRQGLVRQLFMPVRWVETIQQFAQKSIPSIVECGPGKVLTGLNKRIVTNMNVINLSDLLSLQKFFHEGVNHATSR